MFLLQWRQICFCAVMFLAFTSTFNAQASSRRYFSCLDLFGASNEQATIDPWGARVLYANLVTAGVARGTEIHSHKLALLGYLNVGTPDANPVMTWQKFRPEHFGDIEALKRSSVEGFTQMTIRPTVYSYPQSSRDKIVFHVNFADPKLFWFWPTGLFAQDEMQVAEHPFLAAWQNHLLQTNPRIVYLNTHRNEIALITGVPRMAEIDSRGIYGNAFRETPIDRILAQTKRGFSGITNFIAMPAREVAEDLKGKPYAKEDIVYHFLTAVAGFRAARAFAPDKVVEIHTGNWGTGAFGNNIQMMAMIQMFAAHVAGVDHLVYNSFSQSPEMGLALDKVNQFLAYGVEGDTSVHQFIDYVYSLELPYGRSNGT